MSLSNEKLRPRLVAIAVIAVGVVAGGCEGCDSTVTESGIRECPHTWTWEAYDERTGATIEQDLEALTRGAHHVSEYNDCQRFVIQQAGNPVYSAGQFAIFAVQNDSLLDALNDGHRVAVAVIFAEGAYAPLGIERTFSCLVLQARGEGWIAEMYPPDSDSVADCSGPFRTEGRQLTVQSPVPSLPADRGHYAKLARWGYDVEGKVHYMTVTCGDAVCHVGPPDGFTVALPPSLTAASPTDRERRVHEVATWHDQQLLAEFDPSTNNLQPTRVWGTVIPDPDLGDLNTLDQFNRWVKVAEVELSADHSEYMKKGFRVTPGEVRNVVESCVILTNAGGDARTQCPELPDAFLPGGPKCKSSDAATPGESWRSRHIPVEGETKYFCVKRYPLPANGLEVPAAARWRWRADDELLWYRCMWGCCDEQV